MNVYCLYFPDGKRYVGVESETGKRIRNHKNTSSFRNNGRPQAVHVAIRNCGWDKVKWRYLAMNCARKDALGLERFFIKNMGLEREERGHNRSPGADIPSKSGVRTVNLRIDERLLCQLSERTKKQSVSDLARAALELLNIAMAQVESGRTIQFADPSKGAVYVPLLPMLDQSRW